MADQRAGKVYFSIIAGQKVMAGSYTVWEEYNDDAFSPHSVGYRLSQDCCREFNTASIWFHYWRNSGGMEGNILSTECNLV